MEPELLSGVANGSLVAHCSLGVVDSHLVRCVYLDHADQELLSAWDVDVGELDKLVIGDLKVRDSNALS